MAETEAVTLSVGELTNRGESGRGIIRVDNNTMKKLGIKEGDIVEIYGQKKTGNIAVRAYPADVGLNIIRMDGITRKNAGIGVGETVKVSKAIVREAEKIVMAPAQKGVVLQMHPDLLKKNLFMRPLSKGDIVAPFPVVRQRRDGPFGEFFGISFEEIFFTPIPGETRLAVVSTLPEGIVRVGEMTEVELRPEAVMQTEERIPTVTYEDIGGLGDAIIKIREMVELPLRHPELFTKLGIDPPKGVLLYGPPGTGKTLLAKAVANESGANFLVINGPEVMSKWYGQSEANLRKIFEEAEKNAPSIIFIDEIDAIAPKREEVRGEVEKRVVSQLLTMMDGLKARGKVIVIAATNMENSLDPALRRPGRFDREIEIGVPDVKGRKEILQIHTKNMPLEKDVVLDELAAVTYGFTGADVHALCKESAMSSLRRVLPVISWKKNDEIPKDILENLKVTKKDFQNALKMVGPSAMREVLIEIPNVKWSDIGGLEDVKESLKEVVQWPLQMPEAFMRMGIKPPTGVLLYGPPGTGKTMLAKAVATESGANFIAIKGPEILSMWVGESEKKIREIFRRAKQVAPCIIFFDEMDSLAPKRGRDAGSHVMENIVSQILVEISGLEELHNISVIAATNRPDIMDPALLRPGRFERLILVPPPDEKARLEILKLYTEKMPIAKDVDIKELSKKLDGYTGADIEALCREAGITALREDMKAKTVNQKHFDAALENVKPTIDPKIMSYYKKAGEKLRKANTEEKSGEMDYVG